ncbi:hypothetical protein [Roseomonas sp. 18066]|uniref:hypothetical protein n=1 Tax=Roseomonas sp. 18066 TaxID=2681412 RepID=UPI0013589A6F|nr:hypothetical protein [Roseomonas sp. 18066]
MASTPRGFAASWDRRFRPVKPRPPPGFPTPRQGFSRDASAARHAAQTRLAPWFWNESVSFLLPFRADCDARADAKFTRLALMTWQVIDRCPAAGPAWNGTTEESPP